MNNVKAYDLRDNVTELRLYNNNIELANYASILEVKLISEGVTYSSLTDSDIWVDTTVKVKFGRLGLGKGTRYFRVVTTDTSNLNGITWEDNLIVYIK